MMKKIILTCSICLALLEPSDAKSENEKALQVLTKGVWYAQHDVDVAPVRYVPFAFQSDGTFRKKAYAEAMYFVFGRFAVTKNRVQISFKSFSDFDVSECLPDTPDLKVNPCFDKAMAKSQEEKYSCVLIRTPQHVRHSLQLKCNNRINFVNDQYEITRGPANFLGIAVTRMDKQYKTPIPNCRVYREITNRDSALSDIWEEGRLPEGLEMRAVAKTRSKYNSVEGSHYWLLVQLLYEPAPSEAVWIPEFCAAPN